MAPKRKAAALEKQQAKRQRSEAGNWQKFKFESAKGVIMQNIETVPGLAQDVEKFITSQVWRAPTARKSTVLRFGRNYTLLRKIPPTFTIEKLVAPSCSDLLSVDLMWKIKQKTTDFCPRLLSAVLRMTGDRNIGKFMDRREAVFSELFWAMNAFWGDHLSTLLRRIKELIDEEEIEFDRKMPEDWPWNKTGFYRAHYVVEETPAAEEGGEPTIVTSLEAPEYDSRIYAIDFIDGTKEWPLVSMDFLLELFSRPFFSRTFG